MNTKGFVFLRTKGVCASKINFASEVFFGNDGVLIIDDIIGNSENSLISQEEFNTYTKSNNYAKIYEIIILNYQKLTSKFKYIAINSLDDFLDSFSFSIEIAKNLNLPVIFNYESDDEFETFKNIISNKEVEIFAGVNLQTKEIKYINENNKDLKNFEGRILTPMNFQTSLLEKAKKNIKTIVLPESHDDRILKASDILLKTDALNLILLGDENKVKEDAKRLNLDLSKAKIINPLNNEFSDSFANSLYELRKAKGMELDKAKELVKDRTYFGTMLVYEGKADAMVSGASTTTAETIRPALQIIKTKPGIKTVSGAFLMCLDTKMVVFADCAVNPNPTIEDLASIAISSAQTAKSFGLDPKVAMLSYSSGDSGSGADVDMVREATKLVKELDPSLAVEGPIQFDAAFDEIVAKKKMPNSLVAGKANVFVFPNLNCGNICYKAVQRTSGAVAIGPLLQGLKKPVNDLSRGCLVEDIVNTVLISALQE